MYFVAPVDSAKPTQQERWTHCMTTPGCKLLTTFIIVMMYQKCKLFCWLTYICHYSTRLPSGVELTWNYGSETEEGMIYNTGNADTTGTGDGGKIRGG